MNDRNNKSLRHPGVEARTQSFPLLVGAPLVVRSMRTTFVGSAKLGMARREARSFVPAYILSSRHGMHSGAGKGGDASQTRTLASSVSNHARMLADMMSNHTLHTILGYYPPSYRRTQVTRACLITSTVSFVLLICSLLLPLRGVHTSNTYPSIPMVCEFCSLIAYLFLVLCGKVPGSLCCHTIMIMT